MLIEIISRNPYEHCRSFKAPPVGKYARRSLNHAEQELSLKALTRRIVLAKNTSAAVRTIAFPKYEKASFRALEG
jgi:hypothetical protein